MRSCYYDVLGLLVIQRRLISRIAVDYSTVICVKTGKKDILFCKGEVFFGTMYLFLKTGGVKKWAVKPFFFI